MQRLVPSSPPGRYTVRCTGATYSVTIAPGRVTKVARDVEPARQAVRYKFEVGKRTTIAFDHDPGLEPFHRTPTVESIKGLPDIGGAGWAESAELDGTEPWLSTEDEPSDRPGVGRG